MRSQQGASCHHIKKLETTVGHFFSVPTGLRGRLGSFRSQGSEGRLRSPPRPPQGIWLLVRLVPHPPAGCLGVCTQPGREWRRPARVPEARLRVWCGHFCWISVAKASHSVEGQTPRLPGEAARSRGGRPGRAGPWGRDVGSRFPRSPGKGLRDGLGQGRLLGGGGTLLSLSNSVFYKAHLFAKIQGSLKNHLFLNLVRQKASRLKSQMSL